MKTLVCFCLVVMLVGVGGCKKEKKDACVGVVCQNGGHCENGICVCQHLWSGSDCSKLIIPLDSFVGNYHMTGKTTVYNSGQPALISAIDDTLSIAKLNDSNLLFNGFQLSYGSTPPDSFYRYVSYSSYRSVFLQFHKPYTDDSAFYNLNDASPLGTGATIINMSGAKIQ